MNLEYKQKTDVTENINKTALITGANSGIGFETAAQLAENGYRKVILAIRTQEKGEDARVKLIERTGREVFEILTVDVSEFEVVHAAAAELKNRESKIDLLILNAGMSPNNTNTYNSAGVEITFASHVMGHHILTMRLLENDLLSTNAHIVLAGSEGARGDVQGMGPVKFDELASEYFDDNLELAMKAIIRHEKPYVQDKVMDQYVTAKTFSAWWSAVLSRKLPYGMVVNTVSPGSVPSTNYARHQGMMMRKVMMPMMNYVGRFFGMAGSIKEASKRYVDAGQFDAENTGHFYASKPGKLVGKLEIQMNPHFLNREYQEAGWNAIVAVSGGIDYPIKLLA
jgi:NAD(P)-dependent dehydrogenase (short-subunit alcohol dehydrogenase family)